MAVIGSREGITLRQTGGLHILVRGGDKNIIGLVEVTLIAGQFIGVIIPVNLQVKIATVDPIESIVPIQAERQIPVNIGLIGDGRTDERQCQAGCIEAQIIGCTLLKNGGMVKNQIDRSTAWIGVFGNKIRRYRGGGKNLVRSKTRPGGNQQVQGLLSRWIDIHHTAESHLRERPIRLWSKLGLVRLADTRNALRRRSYALADRAAADGGRNRQLEWTAQVQLEGRIKHLHLDPIILLGRERGQLVKNQSLRGRVHCSGGSRGNQHIAGCYNLWSGWILQEGNPQDMIGYMRQVNLIQGPIGMGHESRLIRDTGLDCISSLKRQELPVYCPSRGLNLKVNRTRNILINPLGGRHTRLRPEIDATEGICPHKGQHQYGAARRPRQDRAPVKPL